MEERQRRVLSAVEVCCVTRGTERHVLEMSLSAHKGYGTTDVGRELLTSQREPKLRPARGRRDGGGNDLRPYLNP